MTKIIKKILFVDDEISIRQSFVDCFEDHFWQTFQADTGEQALEIMQIESMDAVIVDIRMDGMDGNDFIRKAYPDNPNTAFVVCTGSPEYDIPVDLKQIPCVSSHIFKKPITDMAILEKVIFQVIESITKS